VAGEEAAAQASQAEAQGQGQGASPAGKASRRTAAPARPIDRSINPLIDQLGSRGFGVVDEFVDAELLAELRKRCQDLHASGALRAARIGRGAQERLAPEVRGDFIAWLSEPALDAEQRLLERLDELRVALNRALMTGLEDFQGHFALYPRGAAYARHFDRLVGSDVRAVSAALYLNENWTEADGAHLRIYTGGGASEDVLPIGGRLVAFVSDRFEHEVLPGQRERMSFTGWFRRRPLEGFI
jgi:SM-20-related protein